MEVKFSRSEIEKLIRQTLMHTRVLRWEGKDLILEVDTFELDRENVRGLDVWTHGAPVEIECVKYCVCSTEKDGKVSQFVVMQ